MFRPQPLRAPSAMLVFEMLEHRQLRSISTYADSYLSTISDYSYFAEVRLGDNGDPGVNGSAIGTSSSTMSSTPIQWDSDLSDGLDSGWRDVSLSLNVSGADQLSLAVDGATTLNYSAGILTHIQQVTVRAAVAAAEMGFAWQNLSIAFYNGNTLIQTDSLSSGPAVDTSDAYTNDSAEAVAVATTTASNCDRVVLTGQVKLTAAADAYPGTNDIFGQVFIK